MPKPTLTENEVSVLAGEIPAVTEKLADPSTMHDDRLLTGMQIGELNMRLLGALDQVAMAWEPLLRAGPEFQTKSIEQSTFGGFILTRRKPSLLQLYACDNCPCGIVDFSPHLFYMAIDRMLGGSGMLSEPIHKVPTEIELRLAERLTAPLLEHLPSVSSRACPAVVTQLTTNAQSARWLPSQALVAVATIGCELAQLHGTLELAFVVSQLRS